MAASARPTTHDPYLALRMPTYRNYMTGSFAALVGCQAVSVAAMWEVYRWTGSATALGLVGFINLLPLLALSLPAGALADRSDRRAIIERSQVVLVFLSLGLMALSFGQAHIPYVAPLRWANAGLRQVALFFERYVSPDTLRFEEPALPPILLPLGAISCLRIVGWPSRATIVPLLLPTSRIGTLLVVSIVARTVPALGRPKPLHTLNADD